METNLTNYFNEGAISIINAPNSGNYFLLGLALGFSAGAIALALRMLKQVGKANGGGYEF